MKIGCCVSLWEELALQLPAAGADYAEGGFSSLRDKTLAQVKSRAGQLAGAGLDTPVMNLLFPGDFQLAGPQAEFSTVDRYLEENLPKAAAFGVKTLVFGSGGARRVPEGFPQEEAFAQLVELCRDHIAPAVETQGMVCCLEPLQRGECNILTSSQEAFQLVQAVGRPGVQLLVDLFHFDLEQEPLSVISRYQGHLGHCHIASARNHRLLPQPWDGEDYLPFFQALQSIGYTGRLSLEGDTRGGLWQARSSLAYVKELARQAGL